MIRNFSKYFFWGTAGLGLKMLFPQLPLDFFALAVGAGALAAQGLGLAVALSLALGMVTSALSAVPAWQLALPYLLAIPWLFAAKNRLGWGAAGWRFCVFLLFSFSSPGFAALSGNVGPWDLGQAAMTTAFGTWLLPLLARRFHRLLARIWTPRRPSSRLNVLEARFGKYSQPTSAKGPFGWDKNVL